MSALRLCLGLWMRTGTLGPDRPRPVPSDGSAGSGPAAGGLGLTSTGAALGALLVGALVYRLRLAEALHDPRQWAGEPVAPGLVLRQLAPDVLLSLAVAGVGLLLAVGWGLLAGRLVPRWPRLRQAAGLVTWTVLLLLYGMLCQAQRGTLLATGNGLTLELLRESLEPAALRESLHLLDRTDVLCLLLPAAVFLLLWPTLRWRWRARSPRIASARQPQRDVSGVVGGAVAAVLGLWVISALWPAAPLGEAALHHPVGALGTELLHRGLRQALGGPAVAAPRPDGLAAPGAPSPSELAPGSEPESAEPAAEVAAAAGEGAVTAPPTMALKGPLFAHDETERPIRKRLPEAADGRPYNVVLVLMESTGLDYALKPQPDGRVAMPFLSELGRRGTLLTEHFSAGNSSPRGIFSLLSGLYVMPEVAIWDVRKDVYLPSLMSHLPASYRGFLVTPASLDWYFPHSFMQHAGFEELWGYHAVPVRKNAPGGRSHARDEAETVGFFLKRLQEASARSRETAAPFVAVYYSFVAHWPYPDYGPESHFLSPTRPLNLYYNNLHYLDKQIERIYKKSEELGLIDNTIFIFAGDHGEAFGQHPHNYTHSRMSYNENFRTPALLLHPRLFPPRRVPGPTSHVDILPTLLDALGARYEPRLLQGESLFQDHFQRKYIFLYGNEDTLSSISESFVKMQISFRDNSCWAFDLKADPSETRRLSCQAHRPQYEALLTYRKNQQAALRRYNQYMRTAPSARQRTATRPATASDQGA